MRILAVLILFAGLAVAQDQKPEILGGPDAFKPAQIEMPLLEVEILRGRVLGVEQGQLIERRTNLLKPIQADLEALNKAIADYNAKLVDVEKKILADRKLEAAKYRVNWKDSKIEERK